MNKEEIKAIESLKGFAYTIHGTLSVGEARTILNLIKNLQKENEELEKKDKDTHKLQELLDISDAKNVNKDKIINELEDIFYNYQLCEYELTDCRYRKCEYIADDEIPPCKECIKQYFERKLEEDK